MATTIKLKSGSGAPLAGDLVAAEPAFDLTNKRLYTEDSGGTVIEVGTNPGTDVTFADNRKAIFGAGSDLQIYHDGSNSYITDAGTGDLRIRGANVEIQTGGGNKYFQGAANIARLYHTNNERLATTSTGIDVTGDVNSDSVTTGTFTSTGIDDNATSTAITIDSSENVGIGTTSPSALLHLESSTNAQIRFSDADDPLNNFVGLLTGSDTLYIACDEDSASANSRIGFRIDGTEHMRIDTGGNVGIGVTDPDNLLTVGGGTQPRILIRANGDAGASQLNFGDASDIDVGRLRYDHSDDSMGFFTSATERMRIDSSGHAIIPAGITLGTAAGTYNAANTLDDYEEGTWTGIVADAASGGNESASACYGYYTKVGNIVYVHFNVANINTTGLTAGNDVYITGLPFTSNSVTGNAKYTGTAHMSVVTFDQTPIINMDENQTAIRIAEVRSAAGIDFVVVSQLSSGVSDIHGNLVYQTA